MFLEEAAGISQVQGAPPRDREPARRHAREPRARHRHPPGARRAAREARGAGQGRHALQGIPRRAAAQAAPALVPAPARRRRRARAPRAGDSPRPPTSSKPRTPSCAASSRASRPRAPRTTQAGDAMNAAQGALYAANAEVARHRIRAAPRRGDPRAAGEPAHRAPHPARVVARAALAAHPGAAYVGGRAGRSEAARRPRPKQKLEAESARLPQAEQADSAQRRKRWTQRAAALMQAEGRLQLEQANFAHLERGVAGAGAAPRAPRRPSCRRWSSPTRSRCAELEAGMAGCDDALAHAEREFEDLQAEHGAAGRAARRGRRSAGRSRSASTPPPRRSSPPCARSRPRPRTTRRCSEWLERHGLGRPRGSGRSCASTRAGKRRSRRCCASVCTRWSYRRFAAFGGAVRPAAGQGERVRCMARMPRAHRRRSGFPLAVEGPRRRPGGRRRGRRLAGGRGQWSKARPTRACARRCRPGSRPGEPRGPPVHAPHGELPRARPGRRRAARAPGRDRGAREALRRARRPSWRWPKPSCSAPKKSVQVRSAALDQARLDISQRQKALHDAQIEGLKLGAGAGALSRAQRPGARGAR